MKKVVVAAINSHALGGGCELAMACDYRLMKKGKALIGLPEATLGILPGAGGTQRLPRLVGLSKAMDILLRGKAMGPEEALAIGLVDRLIEPEIFMEEVMKFASLLASGAGKAMGYIKAAVYEGSTFPWSRRWRSNGNTASKTSGPTTRRKGSSPSPKNGSRTS